MNVTKVRVSDWDKKDGNPVVKVSNVTFDDGREIPGYDLPPGIEEGKPLPDGWDVATAKSGNPYIRVPKASKGAPQAAFRNTQAGQVYEQERMDRRTALMQSVTAYNPTTSKGILTVADEFYEWLRETSASASPSQASSSGSGESRAKANIPAREQAKSPSAAVAAAASPTPSASDHQAGVNDAGASPQQEEGKTPVADGTADLGVREGTSGSDRLTKEEQKTFAKTYGGVVNATRVAGERYGVSSLAELTKMQALVLGAEITTGHVK